MGQKWSKFQMLTMKMNSQGRQLFQRGFQNYNCFLAREALIAGEGRPENLEKMAQTRKPIVMQIREWSILIEILASTPWHQSFCITLVFLHARSNYLLKTEEVSFHAKFFPNFAVLPSLKLSTFSNFDS